MSYLEQESTVSVTGKKAPLLSLSPMICVNPVNSIIGYMRFCFFFPVKEDWNVRITKLRKQVEEIFNLKFGK